MRFTDTISGIACNVCNRKLLKVHVLSWLYSRVIQDAAYKLLMAKAMGECEFRPIAAPKSLKFLIMARRQNSK